MFKKKSTKYDIIKGDPYETWRRKKELGEGSYGKVWLYVKDTEKVAIKEFDKSEKESEAEFNNEVKAFKKTGEHEHIVRFLAAFEKLDCYSIALEFCRNGSLDQMFKYNYTEEQVRDVILQCSLALVHMKKYAYVHRDIKPENIFVRKWVPLNVAIGDFNFSRAVVGPNHTTVMETNLGTDSYKAPELDNRFFRNVDKRYNYKVDVFALGMVAYEFISNGKRPNYSLPFKTLVEIRRRHKDKKLKFSLEVEKIKALKEFYKNMCDDGVELVSSNWDLVTDDAKQVIGQMILPLYERRCDYDFILKSNWCNMQFPKKLPSLNKT